MRNLLHACVGILWCVLASTSMRANAEVLYTVTDLGTLVARLAPHLRLVTLG